MKVLGRIFLNSRKDRQKDIKTERHKDGKTERRNFFVSCRRTYVLTKSAQKTKYQIWGEKNIFNSKVR